MAVPTATTWLQMLNDQINKLVKVRDQATALVEMGGGTTVADLSNADKTKVKTRANVVVPAVKADLDDINTFLQSL